MSSQDVDDLRAQINVGCVQRKDQPRSPSNEGEAEQMLSNQDAQKAPFQSCEQGGGMLSYIHRFIATAPGDIAPAVDCLWGHDALGSDAMALGVYLADRACPFSGESIVALDEARSDAGIEQYWRVFLALDQLVNARVITSWTGHDGSGRTLIHCFFEVDGDAYYGDDTNPPADWAFEDSVAWRQDQEAPSFHDDDSDDIPPDDPNPKRHRVFLKTNYRCFYCIEAWAEHVDHMHPKVRGGSNADENLIGACRTCNVRKNDRTVEEYRAYLAHRNRLPSVAHVRFYGERAQ